ncbi:response regulator [Flavobacterium sp.]|uniref:response regulator n=1 Tax=Flavobacterium sp. TaxID=239 RepID=UPI00261D5D52|nr:response regulator [Flavobacterium sp.]MDD3004397.1 response regulator [Flavobacterium sp.]
MKLEKVICVDDDPIALLLSKLVLSKAEFTSQVITAENGEVALQYLEKPEVIEENEKSQFPLLILLDLNMPVMDGWEFLEQFSKTLYPKHYKKAQIILLSSSIDPNDIERSKTFEMVADFLPKPLTREMLEIIGQKVREY